MRFLIGFVLSASMTLHVPAAAGAEGRSSPVPAKVPRWTEARGTGQNIEIQFYQGFARCVSSYGRQFAENLLSTVPNSSAALAAGKQIGEPAGGCLMRGSVRLRADRARGAIAEVLVKTADKTPLSGTSPFSKNETFQSFVSKIAPAAASMTAFSLPAPVVARWAAYCAARENSSAVLDVLKTPHGSRSELRSLDQLNSTLSNCLPGEQILDTNVRSFRAYLAESLYWRKLAEAASNAQG